MLRLIVKDSFTGKTIVDTIQMESRVKSLADHFKRTGFIVKVTYP